MEEHKVISKMNKQILLVGGETYGKNFHLLYHNHFSIIFKQSSSPNWSVTLGGNYVQCNITLII
jgi:hypothetical protein